MSNTSNNAANLWDFMQKNIEKEVSVKTLADFLDIDDSGVREAIAELRNCGFWIVTGRNDKNYVLTDDEKKYRAWREKYVKILAKRIETLNAGDSRLNSAKPDHYKTVLEELERKANV